jgi:hypothetical protein
MMIRELEMDLQAVVGMDRGVAGGDDYSVGYKGSPHSDSGIIFLPYVHGLISSTK